MVYIIKRYVVEEFIIDAESKEQALLNIGNPHTITVIKETIKRRIPNEM